MQASGRRASKPTEPKGVQTRDFRNELSGGGRVGGVIFVVRPAPLLKYFAVHNVGNGFDPGGGGGGDGVIVVFLSVVVASGVVILLTIVGCKTTTYVASEAVDKASCLTYTPLFHRDLSLHSTRDSSDINPTFSVAGTSGIVSGTINHSRRFSFRRNNSCF